MKLAQLEQELQRARQQVRENNPLVKAISSVPATFPDPVHWLICRVHTQMGIWETQISDSQDQWIQVRFGADHSEERTLVVQWHSAKMFSGRGAATLCI
jgi:hypothetical protein